MASCVIDGKLVITNPSDLTTCSFVTLTGQELRELMPQNSGASHNPFEMSRQDAVQLGVAIATIWIAVGAIKLIRNRI
jgi:hypothetical protein